MRGTGPASQGPLRRRPASRRQGPPRPPRTPASSAIRIATWNTRWLLSPHTEQGTRKRAFINDFLLQGTVVALQETHWTPTAAAVWGGLFPGSLVVESSAPPPGGPEPDARPRGGVAIIVPHPFTLAGSRVLFPGYGLSATISHPSLAEAFHLHNIYLPLTTAKPRRRRSTTS